jgi:hypothetical protein
VSTQVVFVLSNPGHHLEMMRPVAQEFSRRGVHAHIVSLAELRGFVTPSADEVPIVRAIPATVRRDPAAGAGTGAGTGGGAGAAEFSAHALARRALQQLVWTAALGPRLRFLLRHAAAVVVPNDAAFPYDNLARQLRGRNPLVLMQEGIRFPLPSEAADSTYGRGGAARICAWGQASAEHFARIGVPPASVVITGNPRYDQLSVDTWKTRSTAVLGKYQLSAPPLLYLSNPVDDQGFCTTAEKYRGFRQFLDDSAAALAAAACPVLVRLHPREDARAFQSIIDRGTWPVPVALSQGEPLFSVLGCARAAVVLASTVGLEALLFALPLGVLELPGHGYAFEYVQRGAAAALRRAHLANDVAVLLSTPPATHLDFIERHLSHRGHAAARTADAIIAAVQDRGQA